MPLKPIELPPAVARRFMDDMRAFPAASKAISVSGGNTYVTNFFNAGANPTISSFKLSVTPTATVSHERHDRHGQR